MLRQHHKMLIFSAFLALTLCFAAWVRAAAQEDSLRITTVNGGGIYNKLCAPCHGVNGEPPAEIKKLLNPPPPNLMQGSFKNGDSFDQIAQSITKGFGQNMLSFSLRLSEEQIEAVARYVLQQRQEYQATSSEKELSDESSPISALD